MQKELNKKLNVDSINWVDVIKGLEGKTTFGEHDIKRALKKTGRSFNNNGPFHAVVKRFKEVLGSTVRVDMVFGKPMYTITSTEDAIRAVSPSTPLIKRAMGRNKLSAKGEKVIVAEKEPVKSETPEPIIPDEDKIRGLFKKSYTSLEEAIFLLAIFIKHAETKLSCKIIKTELIDLGVNYNSFIVYNKKRISEIFDKLGFNPIIITRVKGTTGKLTEWKLEGKMDLLDEYTQLSDIYEKLAGKKPRNLDDYIITPSPTKNEVEKKYEALKEAVEKAKKAPRMPRTEKNQEIIWKKWLLISSSKNYLGVERSISNLVDWIKTNRHYVIDEEEAKKLYCELMDDTEGELRYNPVTKTVSMSEKAWVALSKFYTPTKLKETILVKLPLTLERMTTVYSDLDFTLDETTTSGMYFYTVNINRGIKCELALKKLLEFIKIAGKIYTENSWMVKRVEDIISKENSEKDSKNVFLIGLEDKI